MTKPLPASLTDLQDTSRPFVLERGGPVSLVSLTVNAKAFWETGDGVFHHIKKVLHDPDLQERLVDKSGFRRLQRKIREVVEGGA